MKPDLHPVLQLIGPLSLAAYAAWAAVWLSLGEPRAFDPSGGWLSPLAMLLFLAAFAADNLLDRRSIKPFLALCLLMALAALVVIGLHPRSAGPILLVLLAGMLATRLSTGQLLLALLAVNLPMAAILLQSAPGAPRLALVSAAAYVSFQVFAALVMGYARRSEAMAEQLREVNAELLATRSLLAARTRDQERLRLSRELHDVAGHSLTALKLNLAALARDPRQPDPQRVTLCAELADQLLQNLRSVVAQMRQHGGVDLLAAIRQLAAPFPRPQLHIELGEDAAVDDIDCAEAILRTVQEGLTNAARHSAAANLWVVLLRDGDRLRLEQRDDGRADAALRPGHGLAGMRERLQAAGGGLDIEHVEGSGLQLHAWLPASCAA